MSNEIDTRTGRLARASAVNPYENQLERIYNQVFSKPYFANNEQGMYHPFFQHLIKLRNNRMTDIFTDNNTGIRLDPATESINMFANAIKHHIGEVTSWVSRHSTEYVRGTKTIKAGQLVIEVGGNEKVTIKGNARVEINGNVDANVRENATIKVGKNVNVRGRNVDITADQTLYLDGRTVLIGIDKPVEHNAARWDTYEYYDDKGRKRKDRRVIESQKVWLG